MEPVPRRLARPARQREQFRERFANPIEQAGDRERLAGLARTVRPFILRRTKAEVVPELPPRTDVQLTSSCRRPSDLVAGVLDQADAAGALSTKDLIELIRSGRRHAPAAGAGQRGVTEPPAT